MFKVLAFFLMKIRLLKIMRRKKRNFTNYVLKTLKSSSNVVSTIGSTF